MTKTLELSFKSSLTRQACKTAITTIKQRSDRASCT